MEFVVHKHGRFNNRLAMKTPVLLLFILALFSCDRRQALRVERETTSRYANLAPPPAIQASDVTADQSPTDRKLIRNGHLTIQTDDISRTRNEVEKLCKTNQAYIASETQNNYDHRLQYEQVIRVPGNSFDTMMKNLEALGKRTENKNIEATDVTEQFIDTEARIRTQRALELRYIDILKKATAVKDMLEIEGHLTEVRGEIERMEGRLKYLSNQVEYSTISLTYFQPLKKTDFGFGDKVMASLGNGWEMLLAFVIGLLNIWPFIILLTGGIYLFVRWLKNRRAVYVESVEP
jgi:hypothetical protein